LRYNQRFSEGIIGEKDLEAKRKEFQMISEAMYDLTRTIRYDQQKIYHQYCPMAFNDAGAIG
jgi:Cu(I)/Ag(I) efflux system membrane fusion protein